MIGKFVYHRKYGKGQVVDMIGCQNYYIQFDTQKKELVFPYDSFTEEYFILDKAEIESFLEKKA